MRRFITLRTALIFFTLILVFPLSAGNQRIELLSGYQGSAPWTIHTESESGNSIRFSIEIPIINSTEINTGESLFSKLSIEGFSEISDPGKPALPILGRMLAVPGRASVDVKIMNAEFTELDNIFVPPALEPLPEDASTKFQTYRFDNSIYENDAYFPEKVAWTESEGIMRGVPLAALRISPVQFNPIQKKVKIMTRFEVVVTFQGDVAGEIVPRLRSPHFERIFQRMIVNWDKLSAEAVGKNFEDNTAQESLYGADYLIITHQEFEEAADSLVAWRRMTGLDAEVALIGDIGNSSEDIRNYIQFAYDNWDPAPSFILLMGDAEFIPTNYFTAHPSDDNGTIGTDLYYTTVDGSDYFPDIIAGRISVDTGTDAMTFVRKVIQYEKNPLSDPEFYNRAIAAAYFQDDDDPDTPNFNERDGYEDRRFVLTSEEIRNLLLSEGYSVDRIYNCEEAVNPTHYNNGSYANGEPIPQELLRSQGFEWNGNASQISSAINQGYFLVTHRDHGARSGWGDTRYLTADVKGLSNGPRLPVVFSTNCNTGWFDNETDDDITSTGYTSECFVEFWFRNYKGGAIGVFGSTRVSYSGYNDALAKGFFDALWPQFLSYQPGGSSGEPIYHLGEILNYGKMFMASQYSGTNTRRVEFEEFHYYGDPATSLWTGLPQEFVVDASDSCFFNQTELVVSVDQRDATVTLLQHNQILATTETDQSGFAVLRFSPIHSDESLKLCITKPNYKPHIKDINIYSGEALSIIVENVSIIDQNSDGKVNTGETIYWSLLLSNVGTVSTEQIQVNLTCEDTLFTLLESSATVEALNVNEKSTLSALSFKVSNRCPARHRVEMNLNIQAGADFQLDFPLDFMVVQGNPEIEVSPDLIAHRVSNLNDSINVDLTIMNKGFGKLNFSANEEGRNIISVGDSDNPWWATISEGAGNVLLISEDVNLLRFSSFLNIISPVEVYFVIYEGDNATGLFYKIAQNSKTVSTIGQFKIWSDLVDLKLSANKYYCLGVSWTGGDAQICRAFQVPPFPIEIGEVATGTLNFGGSPPADSINQTFSKLIAFVQEVETGTGTWLSYSSVQSTLFPGEEALFPLTMHATHQDTTFYSNIVINSNDENKSRVELPVYLMVGSSNTNLISQVLEIDDSEGNNNREINLGEHIAMPITVKNLGVGTASNVQAKLWTDDPNVTVTDSSEFIGNIESNHEVTTTAFEMDISPYCEDGYIFSFEVKLEADGYETTVAFSREVKQGNPVLAFDPDSVKGTIDVLGDSLITTVDIQNDGFGKLIYNMENPVNEKLDVGTIAEGWWLPLKNGIGNIVYQIQDAHVLGMQCYFQADSGTIIYFSIYECDSLKGEYRCIAQSQTTVQQTGDGWQAPLVLECDLQAEKYYYFGTSWIGNAQVVRLSETLPFDINTGKVLSSAFNLSGAPPVETFEFQSVSSIPIAQKIIVGSGWWLDCPTEPDTLYPGEFSSIPIQFFATAPETTFTANISVFTNQQDNRIKSLPVSLNVTAVATNVTHSESTLPKSLVLEQNYPNPFNPTTDIRYGINRDGKVELLIFNVLGQKVRTLVTRNQSTGYYSVTWDGLDEKGMNAATGVYFVILKHGNGIQTKKILLLK